MKDWIRIACCVLLASSVTGCGSTFALRCEDPGRYADSGEVPPIQIPDDLDPPDESQSLRIPAPPSEGEVEQLQSRGPCLESPPDFFEAGAPG